ncbi:hypothetical protein R84B8_00720 [Treponema sp. R8-4-B8]
MNIEDIKIEDATDANYVIKKFFNNNFKNMKMEQLEQLVLAVYNMGKKSGGSTDGATDESEPKTADKAPEKVNPFKITDRVKILEDIEVGHSGEVIQAGTVGSVTYSKGDAITVLFEEGEDGEMVEVSVSPDKIEKV